MPWRRGFMPRQVWNYRIAVQTVSAARNPSTRFCYLRYARQFVPWIRYLKRRLGRVPLVIEVNSFGAQQYGIVASIEARAFALADVVVCVSETLREEICTKLGARLADKVVVIPNGVDLDRFERSGKNERPSLENVNIGYVGTLKADYGIETIIQGMSLLNEAGIKAILHIVGEGPQRRRLEQLAQTMSYIKFRGAVSFDRIPEILQTFDMLVYSTTARNLFQSPIKIYEYMAASRPIIAMRTPAIEQLIQDGVSGILVPLGSAAAVAEAVQRISSLPDRGDIMGKTARQVVEKHSWTARIALLLDALRRRGYSV